MLVIPAIDLISGEAVRLRQGDYGQKRVYSPNPVDLAQEFEHFGATWIHIVDLDGAKSGSPANLSVLESVRGQTGLKIQWGGGIRTAEAFRTALQVGADRVVVGSRLVMDLEECAAWVTEFGDRVVAGIDMRNGMASTAGWGVDSEIDGLSLGLNLSRLGCHRFVVTDIATDGMLEGPNLAMIRDWVERCPGAIVASGGVSSQGDLENLAATGCEAVIVGKAIYEGHLNLKQLWQ